MLGSSPVSDTIALAFCVGFFLKEGSLNESGKPTGTKGDKHHTNFCFGVVTSDPGLSIEPSGAESRRLFFTAATFFSADLQIH
jgi:hypothetical protein